MKSHFGIVLSSITCKIFQPCFLAFSFCAKIVTIYFSSIWYEVPFIWNPQVLSMELYLHDLHIFLFTFLMYFDLPAFNWTSYFSWYSSTNWKPNGKLRINVGIWRMKKKGFFADGIKRDDFWRNEAWDINKGLICELNSQVITVKKITIKNMSFEVEENICFLRTSPSSPGRRTMCLFVSSTLNYAGKCEITLIYFRYLTLISLI